MSLAEIGENLIECRELEEKERHVYSTLYTWRKSIGKEGWLALNGLAERIKNRIDRMKEDLSQTPGK